MAVIRACSTINGVFYWQAWCGKAFWFCNQITSRAFWCRVYAISEHPLDKALFYLADFLSRPPGFYVVLVAMVFCTALVPLGLTDVVTYVLSVAAIVITGVVLIQGYRDTAAIHAKLDEIVVALEKTRNEVVGLEHADSKEIEEELKRIEEKAKGIVPSARSR